MKEGVQRGEDNTADDDRARQFVEWSNMFVDRLLVLLPHDEYMTDTNSHESFVPRGIGCYIPYFLYGKLRETIKPRTVPSTPKASDVQYTSGSIF